MFEETEISVNPLKKRGPIFWSFGLIGLILVILSLFLLRLVMTIPSTGTVAARNEAYLFAPYDATLTAIHAAIGQEVKQGDPVFELQQQNIEIDIIQINKEISRLKTSLALNDLTIKELEIAPAGAEILSAQERLTRLNEIRQLQQETLSGLEELNRQQLVTRNQYNHEQVNLLRTEIDRIQTSLIASWGDKGLIDIQRQRLLVQNERLARLIQLTEEENKLLQLQKTNLTLRAPISGQIVHSETRHTGMAIPKGTRMAKIVNLQNGYRIKARVPQRNIDLIQPGTKARMRSSVFDSIIQGYIYGTVSRITPEPADRETQDPHYEIELLVDETPYPLVLGSNVNIDFIISRQNIFNILMSQPASRTTTSSAP